MIDLEYRVSQLWILLFIWGWATIFMAFLVALTSKTFPFKRHTKRYPDEPWKWNKEWQEKRMQRPYHSFQIFLWLSIFLLALFGKIAFLLMMYVSYGEKGWGFTIITLILVVLPTSITVQFKMARNIFRWLKYGYTILEIEELPVRIGRPLKGKLIISNAQQLNENTVFHARLKCIYSPSFKKETPERMHQQVEFEVTPELIKNELHLDINFILPDHLQPTITNKSGEIYKYEWRIEIKTKGYFANFYTEMTLPVY